MKKRFLALLLTALLLCGCVACASKTAGNGGYTAKAVTIGNHTIHSVELNYFYIDTINEYVQQYSGYLNQVLDVNKPLNEQVADESSGRTWADTFLQMTLENMKSTYALYDLAVAEGYQLSQNEQNALNTALNDLSVTAAYYGYDNVNAYLCAVYDKNADIGTYRSYYEKCALADSYYEFYMSSMGDRVTKEELTQFAAGKEYTFHAYHYSYFYIPASWFLEGGTKDANGIIIYSDEEKSAAVAKAEQAAKKLAEGERFADLDAFNEGIQNSGIQGVSSTDRAVEYTNVQYASLSAMLRPFLTGLKDGPRVEGDMTVLSNALADEEGGAVDGYYVVRYGGVNKNDYFLRNVRHILIQFKGGTYNPNTGETTYTIAEKKATRLDADLLLKQWQDGAATEESFAQLAVKESDDAASNVSGGLLSNVYPGQLVAALEQWVFASDRKAGDTSLVETSYGYHIVFYAGDSDITFYDYMVRNELLSEKASSWYQELLRSMTYQAQDTSCVKMDLIIGS